jgi:hypothetical protein
MYVIQKINRMVTAGKTFEYKAYFEHITPFYHMVVMTTKLQDAKQFSSVALAKARVREICKGRRSLKMKDYQIINLEKLQNANCT